MKPQLLAPMTAPQLAAENRRQDADRQRVGSMAPDVKVRGAGNFTPPPPTTEEPHGRPIEQ